MLPVLLASLVGATLSNGLEVSVFPDPTMPVVATQVWYRVGAAHENPGNRGLAHMFEHLMFGGTAEHPKGDYSQFVTAAGGDDNAFTSEDETVYVAAAPPEALEGILRREADRMRGLVLTEEELATEKLIVAEELRLRTENDPMSRLLVEAQRALLGSHPYSFDPAGSKEDLARASLADCRSFYDAYYWPNHAHLVIVGPVDPKETLRLVEDAFGAIPRGGRDAAEIPPLVGWTYPRRLDLREDLPPVEIALTGMPLPEADAPEAPAVAVMIEMLSGGSIDPFREIVVTEHRKALEAGIESIGLKRGGGIVFYAASLPYRRSATAFRSIDLGIGELDELGWLTETDLGAAKRRLLLDELTDRYDAAQLAERIGAARSRRGNAAEALRWSDRLRAVSRDEVAGVWRRYVRDGTHVRVYVKPERVPILIRMFGWLYPLFS